jgi:DNA-binding MarR family transcriptional regulator/N-acetylglutamate synthase-like GNAT family acetyltransferase
MACHASFPRSDAGRFVPAVRAFNRFYTRHIGLLQQGLLESEFSLTEVRLLYEIAHRPNITAKVLCSELSLDPGYLSRILAKFQKRGWVQRTKSPVDGREVLLLLTSRGSAVFRPLDERSSQQVEQMLSYVAPVAQQRLVGAMRQIEEILSAHSGGGELVSSEPYVLRAHQPGDMGWVVFRHGVLYAQEYLYDERFEALVAEICAEFIQKFDAKHERCWIAERDGERVGSVFLVRKSASVAKLRLLLVEPSTRGMGIGKRLVEECIRFARQVGYKKIVLWTQSELKAARGIYQQTGFCLVAEEEHDSWSRKGLVAETWELKL